jgi:hypothetical protein
MVAIMLNEEQYNTLKRGQCNEVWENIAALAE